jgi:hypothetical protein
MNEMTSMASFRKYGLKILTHYGDDNGRTGPWTRWKWPEIGEWTQPIKELQLCRSGYHLTPLDGLVAYIANTMRDNFVSFDVYLTEWDGEMTWGPAHFTAWTPYWGDYVADKFACERARLLEKLPWDVFDWEKWLFEDWKIKQATSYTFWEAARRFSICTGGTASWYDPITYGYNSKKGQVLMQEMMEKWDLLKYPDFRKVL